VGDGLDIHEKRLNYLRKIREYRAEGREIVYMDESYIHGTHTAEMTDWLAVRNILLRLHVQAGSLYIDQTKQATFCNVQN
jgi:hypothetical protein